MFDETFREPSAGLDDAGMRGEASSSESAGLNDSEAYKAFLCSDVQSGELATMKNDWLRRMRLEIVDLELKFRKLGRDIEAHKASFGEASKDTVFAKNKFFQSEMKSNRQEMTVDTEEGNVGEK